jgi:hypothetical protein
MATGGELCMMKALSAVAHGLTQVAAGSGGHGADGMSSLPRRVAGGGLKMDGI